MLRQARRRVLLDEPRNFPRRALLQSQLPASLPAHIAARAHRTVSQSEAGFEKVMQAVELTLTWPLVAGTEQLLTLEFSPLA